MNTEIKTIKLEVKRNPAKFDYYTPEDEALFVDLIKKDEAFAIFLYSRNVLTKDGIRHFDENDKNARAVARSGEMYVPMLFFTNILKVSVAGDSNSGYLSLKKVCSEIGFNLKFYNDGLLAVIGSKSIDEQIKNNPRLAYAGGYAVLGKYDASKFTHDDYSEAKKKWCESIVGSPSINDISIPEIREKIEGADINYEKSRSIFHRDMDAVILFGEKPPTDSVDLKTQYDHLKTFAVAYATYGSKYFQNEQLLSDILFGLEWMYLHMYGEAEIEERGWRSAHAYDWWHWFVGASEPLTDILFLVEDHLTMEMKHKYLRTFIWVVSFMRQGYQSDSAMSRIKVCTKGALLLEDVVWLENEFYDYDLLTEVNEEGGGPHIDFVEWTHFYPYNFVYGNNNLNRVLFVGSILGGTPLEFTSPKQYNLFNIARYMFEPILYKGRGAQIFAGRGIVSNEYAWGARVISELLPMIGLFGEDEDIHIKRMIKRNSIMPEVIAVAKDMCQLPELKKYIDILNDVSIPFDGEYEIGHAYFTGDRAVQQRNNYAFTVALASTRHPSYESINGANKIGWYTGDGAVYLSTVNDMHTFDGLNFAVNEKVMMNVPGTTIDTQTRIPWSHRSGIRGSCDFVGCLSIDGSFVSAAMDYHAYDFHGETTPPTDSDYGGGFLPHTNDLVAKKAYFLLDKECVCLGAGITSTTGFSVKTVVEDRVLAMSEADIIGTDRTAIDGVVLPISDFDEIEFESSSYASLEGVGGYVFLEKSKICAEKFSVASYNSYKEGGAVVKCEHKHSKRFFKLTIEHGENPTNASYAYALLPYASDAELEKYAASPEIEIVSNTAECQAVRKEGLGIASYIFYSRGACGEIETSDPCIVAVTESGGEYKIRVCDPTQKLPSISLKINKKLSCLKCPREINVSCGEYTEMLINTDHSVGRPYEAVFKIK